MSIVNYVVRILEWVKSKINMMKWTIKTLSPYDMLHGYIYNNGSVQNSCDNVH